jgi:hypothetical protein
MKNIIEKMKPFSGRYVTFTDENVTVLLSTTGNRKYNRHWEEYYSLPEIEDGYFYVGKGGKPLANIFGSNLNCIGEDDEDWDLRGFAGTTDCYHYTAKATEENINTFLKVFGEEQKEKNKMTIFEKAQEIQDAFDLAKKDDLILCIGDEEYEVTTNKKEAITFDIRTYYVDEASTLYFKGECNAILCTKEFYFNSEVSTKKKNTNSTDFEINGYVGKWSYVKQQWTFGCAKIEGDLITRFANLNKETFKTYVCVDIQAVTIGRGTFTIEQINSMNNIQINSNK